MNTNIRIDKLLANLFFSKMPYNAERFISPPFEARLEELLKERDFDVIQLEGLYLAPYIPVIRKHCRAIVSMRAHNIEHEIWERTVMLQKGPKKAYLKILARRIRRIEQGYVNQYDAILPITARDGEILRQLGCNLPMHVVPTGVNSSDITPDHSGMEFPSVFHIGALDWIPNQEGILWFLENVWEKVLEKYPDVKFYLAGRNAPESFRNLKYPNVVFMGEVEDAYDFMRSHAIMIVPIFAGSGMRIKIIEAMALGKSIVTTTVGTEGIMTTHGSNILIADNAEDFAEEICLLIGNYALFEEIGKNACTFVKENYDNLSITSSLLKFYEELTR